MENILNEPVFLSIIAIMAIVIPFGLKLFYDKVEVGKTVKKIIPLALTAIVTAVAIIVDKTWLGWTGWMEWCVGIGLAFGLMETVYVNFVKGWIPK